MFFLIGNSLSFRTYSQLYKTEKNEESKLSIVEPVYVNFLSDGDGVLYNYAKDDKNAVVQHFIYHRKNEVNGCGFIIIDGIDTELPHYVSFCPLDTLVYARNEMAFKDKRNHSLHYLKKIEE